MPCTSFYYPQYNQHMSGWIAAPMFYINVDEQRKAAVELWGGKNSEGHGQQRYEEESVRVGMGSEMVARVTVRVATPYVNPPIWSILQSKRIGFLWRWISSAGKLSLPSSLHPPTFLSTSLTSHTGTLFFASLCFFLPFPLLSLPLFSKPHHKRVYSATLGSTWSLVIFSKCQFVSPNSHIRDYSMCFFFLIVLLYLPLGFSQRWQRGCNGESVAGCLLFS